MSAILQSSGASLVMADFMKDTFGNSHWFVIILAVTTFIIVLTEFTSNTASAALLVPIFATVAQTLGMPVMALTMIIGIGASCALCYQWQRHPMRLYLVRYIKQTEMVRGVLNLVCILVISCFGSSGYNYNY